MNDTIKIKKHFKENKGCCLLLSFVIFLICLLEYWMMPKWSQELLEALVGSRAGNQDLLLYAIAGLLVTGILLAVLGMVSGWCSVSYRKKITLCLEKTLIEKCCRLESFNDENRLSLLRQTVPQACERETNWVCAFLKTIFGVLCASVFVIMTNWRFLILTYGVSLVFMILSWMRQKKVKMLAGEYEESNNALYEAIWEQVYNREITPYLDVDKVLHSFIGKREKFLQSLLKLKKAGNLPQSIAMLGSGALMAVSLLYGGFLYLQGQMDIGEVYAVTIVVPVLSNVLLQLPSQLVDFQILKGAYQVVSEFLALPEYLEEEKQKMEEPIERIAVSLDTLGYPANPEVLKSVAFDVKKGDFAVLTGISGCGKSTLLRNLAALEKGYTGEILLNDNVLSQISRKSYWNQIDYLGQNPGITKGSVQHNIVLRKTFDSERYHAAVAQAGLSQEVAQKDSLDTLSSGELQKVCFARLFYQDKDIWMLDEATSAMDEKSERQIVQILQQKQKEGKLILTVAHREAFLKAASRWFLVADGTVTEQRLEGAQG